MGNHEFSSSFSMAFEKASMLFNLGAIYSRLGSECPSTAEGVKQAAAYFQQSAGVFVYLAENLEVWGMVGAATKQLYCMSELMLAQAQEAFLAKAVDGKMKDSVLAKLAMQASVFYTSVADYMKELSMFDKSWQSHVQVKALFLHGVCQYHKGLDCESIGKYGESVAYLGACVQNCKAALEYSLVKHLTTKKLPVDIKAFMANAEVKLGKSNKDNDLICI